MTPPSQPIIMWFRQDLRLADHPALFAAAAAGPIVGLYILDDETAGNWRMGAASRWWLHHSLTALGRRIPLILRRGRADAVIADVLRETGATALYFTRDYTPWAGALERAIKAACDAAGAACHRHGGFLLHEPEDIRTGQDAPYKVYTPFARACLAAGEPRQPKPAPQLTPWAGTVRSEPLERWALLPTKPDWAKGFPPEWTPGEDGARQKLETFIEDGIAGYHDRRDRPDLPHTSRLSPHLHFGEISPRQCWAMVRSAMNRAGGRLDRDGEKFLKELLWREFSNHLLHHWPTLPDAPFQPGYAQFPWEARTGDLEKWQRGETGYPIVDAGLRELWTTGFMHNRVRMITASFLVKDLLIPWQDGERWFWDTLLDADLANNAASWQWVAGCGADAAPYFRIFNPVLQGEKFDPDGTYVRRWIPELAKVPAKFLHRPWEADEGAAKPYPPRMVDHQRARDTALRALKTMQDQQAMQS